MKKPKRRNLKTKHKEINAVFYELYAGNVSEATQRQRFQSKTRQFLIVKEGEGEETHGETKTRDTGARARSRARFVATASRA